MNRIKCKINLWRLSKQPAIPQHILLHLLQPYIVPYELQLTDDRIYFSKPLTLKQNVELFLRYSGFFVKNGLPYQDILFIKNMPDSDGIHLYTRTGHVFHFWREGRNWEITNCLRYNEPLFSMRKWYAWGALWKKNSVKNSARVYLPYGKKRRRTSKKTILFGWRRAVLIYRKIAGDKRICFLPDLRK